MMAAVVVLHMSVFSFLFCTALRVFFYVGISCLAVGGRYLLGLLCLLIFIKSADDVSVRVRTIADRCLC